MRAFVIASLCLFTPCAIIGMATPFALAAKYRRPAPAIMAFLIAAWAVVVLISAAVMLS